MKIALVVGTFFPQPGGAQVQAHNICNKQKEKNLDIDCYIFNKTNINNNNYKIIILSKFLISLVFFFRYYLNLNLNFLLKGYLKKIIKSNNYEFWHFIFLNHKCLILINCLKQLNQKVLVTFQGADIQVDQQINYGFRINKKYDKNLKRVLNKIDHFFYISQTIKKDLVDLNISEKKMSYAPNSVEIEKFKNFHDLRLKSEKLRLITVARYAPKKKGYDKLFYIGKELIQKKIDFEWKIIGAGTDKLKSHEFIKKNKDHFKIYRNIENSDETYFPHSNLIKLYLDSDIYINLARIESFGITFIEALASQIPIITYDTKGANEIVIDNVNGYLIKNDEYLIKKILEISKNRKIINDMKNNLLNTILKYDLNLVTEKYEKLRNKIN
jgi:glycosyltransferase involved in cell wall biosynthesis